MSKNKKTLIALLIVTALIAAVILVFALTAPEKGSSSETSDETVYIYSAAKDNFISATVTNPLGSYTLEKTADGFAVNEVSEYEQDTYSTNWIGEKLLSLNATKRIDDPSADLSEYGLASPAATCLVKFADATEKKILLGNEAPSGGYYLKLETEKSVYIVNHSLPTYMQLTAANFVETDVIPSAEDYADDKDANLTVSYVLLSGSKRDEEVEITMDPDYDGGDGTEASTPYVMSKPIEYDVNTTITGDMIASVTSIKFSNCIDVKLTPEKIASYGLDNPDYRLKYKFADTTVEIRFAVIDDNTYFALLEGFDAVFTVSSMYVPYLTYPADEFMTRLTFAKSITLLEKLTVEADGKKWVFDVKHPDTGAFAYFNGTPLYQDNFRTYYENLLMTLSEGRTTDTPSTAARLTITYEFNDGSDSVKVEYVPADSMRYVYLVDGEGTFFVLKSQVDSIIADTDLVSRNEVIKTTI